MKEIKSTSMADRLKASAEAKKAMLAKFKPQAHQPDPQFEHRAAQKQAELEAVRAARAAEKEAQRLARLEEEEAKRQAVIEDELSELDAKRKARKEWKAAMKAEARAKKENRGALRRVG